MAEKILKNNKFADFKFNTEDRFEAGIVLNGLDVKDIKKGLFDLRDAFILIEKNEVFLMNLVLESTPNLVRKKKLLLNRSEIAKISQLLANKKYHGFILRIKTNDKNIIKLDIGIGTIKRKEDKKASQKRSSEKRSLERQIKEGIV